MDYPIRRMRPDDASAVTLQDGVSFGHHIKGEEWADALTLLDLDRVLVSTDDGRIVGVAGDYAMTMTTPGASIDVPGVTWVSVSPTHRRRGILRALMQHQLRGFAEAGYPAAILIASESGIYGRFGYGAASQVGKVVVQRSRARLHRAVDTTGVRIAGAERARLVMPDIHERWRRDIPGGLRRTHARWDLVVRDRPSQRAGTTGMFYLLHPDGYLAYRAEADWQDWGARHTALITEYAAVTAQAHAALWQVMLSLDLYERIESWQVPIDDPLPYLLSDPRQARTVASRDGLWLRPLDVPALLRSRRYAVEIEAVWEVFDPLLGDGRYLLRGGPDTATCVRTEALPDLSSDVSALGALFLGGHRLLAMHRAGQVQSQRADLLGRMDRALLADRAPFHGTDF